MYDDDSSVEAPWAEQLAPWADVPFSNWEAQQFAAWLEDFRRWANRAGYEWDHGEQLRDALTIWRAESAAEQAATDRQHASAQAADADRKQRAADAELDRKQRDAAAARERGLAPLMHTADAPTALRALAAWRRLNVGRIIFEVTDDALRAIVLAADTALSTEVTERTAAIAAAEAERDRVRRTRTDVTTPLPEVPRPLALEEYVDADAIGRWIVAHFGCYDLEAGTGYWAVRRSDETDDVVGRDWTITRPSHWDRIQQRASAWAAWRDAEAQAVTYPAEAVEWRAKAEEALLSATLTASAAWSFAPPAPVEMTAAPEPEPARTQAAPGRRPLDDTKLDDRIERRCRRFWGEHNRGPTVTELVENVKGARTERKLERVKALLLEGVLIELYDKGLKVDE